MISKSGNYYLQLPSIEGSIKSITVYTGADCSENATLELYKDSPSGTKIGETYKAVKSGSNTFNIAAEGNLDVYYLVNNSKYNFQLTKVDITYISGPSDYTALDKYAENGLALAVTETRQLNIGNHPENLKFESNDEGVVTVTDEGLVTAKGVGKTTVTATWTGDGENFNAGKFSKEIAVSVSNTATEIITVESFTDATSSTYGEYTFTSSVTGITYVANLAPNGCINIRITNSNSGIVTTDNPNGYYLRGAKIDFNKSAAATDFYGDETNYTSAANLYATAANGNKAKGVKFGSISKSGIVEVPEDSWFTAFGVRSNTGVRYINSITLTWELIERQPAAYTALDDVTVPQLLSGETFQLPLGEKHPSVIRFSSDEPLIATVDETGLISAVGPSQTYITAEWDADEANYFTEGSKTFTVVVRNEAQLSFLHDIVYGKVGVGVVAQAAYYNGDADSHTGITYTSSNPEIIDVDPLTGMIDLEALPTTAGRTTITAKVEGTDQYTSATASYVIEIEDPENFTGTQSGFTTFDFTVKDCYGFTSCESANDPMESKTSITEGDVTLNFTGQYRSIATNGKYELRLQKNSSMTVSVPAGYEISKITVNYTSTTYQNISANCGKYSVSGTAGTWVNNTESSIDKVKFSNSSSDRTGILTMTVTWKRENNDLERPNLSFGENVLYNELVNTDITVAAVSKPDDLDVNYSIDGLNEGEDYTITDNGENLAVNVNKTGVYTLRARSEANDTYLPGIAILRLNVFPAVELKLNDGESFDLTEEGEIVLPEDGGSFTIEGNYPNTVRIWYALNGSADESLYDGTPVEFTDDATLTYHLEYAETDRYRYTTNHSICVTPPAPVCNINHGEEIPTDAKLIFTSKEGTTLLYRVNVTEPAANSAMRAPAATEGWENNGTNTYSFDASELTAGTRVVVSTKALHSNGRIESAQTARAFTVGSGTVTGVENVEAAADNSPVEFFNLQGIRVANPENGIYIRRQGNTVEKVTINN